MKAIAGKMMECAMAEHFPEYDGQSFHPFGDQSVPHDDHADVHDDVDDVYVSLAYD